MPPPNREGTPIDAVGKRRGEEDKANNCTRREGKRLLKLTAHGYRDKSNKGGEGDQRGNRKKFTPNLEGTPIDTVGRRRGEEDKANDPTRGDGESLLVPTAHRYKDNSNKGGEGDQRGNREKSTPNLEGTPIDEVGRRRVGVDKANDSTRGEGER